jgi:ubiquinone/menaquinone biosynthesis C-methylase UbiE
MADRTDLSGFQHPRFARMYERISAEAERRGTAAHRDRVLAGLAGRVIEVGAGNGLNFVHYPPTVEQVVAVEPEDRLRVLAEAAAKTAPVPVRVVAGHAGALPGEDGEFDAAVASLVLCSVADVAAALAEIRRVLRPGGQLRFFEHVRSSKPWWGLLQDALTPL